MKWSYSKSRIFSSCQRKWYYQDIVAHHSAKDESRREAFLLKQLRSIYAWRGSVVDSIIEKQIIPRIIRRAPIKEEEILELADDLVQKQVEFGRNNKHLERGLTKSSAGDAYSAFYEIEYGDGLPEEGLTKAIDDIHTALKILIRSKILQDIIQQRPYMITQRTIQYDLLNSKIIAVPDLILFYNGKPPTIIDWKVSISYADYWKQLAIYAISLSNVNPHSDFKDKSKLLEDPTKFTLIEYQLLRDEPRRYTLNDEDRVIIENHIIDSVIQMERLADGEKYGEIDISRLETARFPETCQRCQFRKICWREMK
jgi:hypothetical protein